MTIKVSFLIVVASIAFTLSLHAEPVKQQKNVQDTLAITAENNVDVISTLPLPEGLWTFGNSIVRTASQGNNTFRNTMLFKSENGYLTQFVEYEVKINGPSTKWGYEPCKPTTFLYKNDFGTAIWRQKCLVIEAVTLPQPSRKITSTFAGTFSKHKIKSDLNAIQVRYTRYDELAFMIVRINIFPSAYGLENPRFSNANASPWSKDNFLSDPEKIKFIEAVKKYAESVVIDFDKAYESGKAKRSIPALTYVYHRPDAPSNSDLPITKKSTAMTADSQSPKQVAEDVTNRASEKSEKQAAEQSAKKTAEQAAKLTEERAVRQAAEKAARQAAEQAAKLAEERAARQAAEKAARQAAEQAAKQSAEHAAKLAEERAARQAAEKAARQASEQAAKQSAEQAAKLAEERAARQAAERTEKQGGGEKSPRESPPKNIAPSNRAAPEKVRSVMDL